MADVGDFDFVADTSDCDCPDPISPLVDVASSSRPNTGPASFGQDVDAHTDVPLMWGMCTGYRNLGNAIARRLDFLRSMLNADLDAKGLSQLRSDIDAAVMADERVQAVSLKNMSFNPQTSTLVIPLTIDTADGPFSTIYQLTPGGVTEIAA